MNKIELKGVEYDLVSSFEEMNLELFEKYLKVLQGTETNLNKTINLISLLSGIDTKILRQSNLTDITNIDISWIFEKLGEEIADEIEIEGIKYLFVGDLNGLSLGEYADLEAVSTEKEAKYQNIHKICSILYRPEIAGKIEEYDYDTMIERAEIFLVSMPITISNPVVSFFLNLNQGS